MKQKQMIKRIIDAAMLLLLPVLMAEILTGQWLHEWLGTALNILLLFDFLTLAVSGMMMSGFVFTWLPFSGGMVTARTLHLFASHWGADPDVPAYRDALETHFGGIALFGIYAFVQQKMTDYLFLRTHFVFFDETKSVFLFYAEGENLSREETAKPQAENSAVQADKRKKGDGMTLIAYFSWGGNTRGIAEEIQAQRDQNAQARRSFRSVPTAAVNCLLTSLRG